MSRFPSVGEFRKKSNLRYVAAKVLQQVINGASLNDALTLQIKNSCTVALDAAFVQALCYGACRYYPRLIYMMRQLLKQALKSKDADISALILIGLYQLMEMRIPDHAVVSETVNATILFKKVWAKKLVNAILRTYIRQKEKLMASSAQDLAACFLHPIWCIDYLQKAWPKYWQAILIANNAHPPFSLRVNTQAITRENFLAMCAQQDMLTKVIPFTDTGVILEQAIPVAAIPGFMAGQVSVQDGAAQLAVSLLDAKPGMHILDACAAPGGKLLHLLEVGYALKVTALEKDLSRMKSIEENIVRLKLRDKTSHHLKILHADATDLVNWWDGILFDRILLDAPCSASGVIRRHPDIKLSRKETHIERLSAIQFHLLQSMWIVLKPGGLLVYATCSIFPVENEHNIAQFLQQHPEASEQKINAEWGIAVSYGRQILPGVHDMDGFYYAVLKK